MATQQFNQTVLQRYGWSAAFEKDDVWVVTVTMGYSSSLGKKHPVQLSFRSTSTYSDPKRGMLAACEVALSGLQYVIQQEEAKPKLDLLQTFSNADFVILDSDHPETWARFWSDAPVVVAIDVEGNQQFPPVLVQIATDQYCILEVPRNGTISSNLRRLLQDSSITKVFCDNFSQHDKTCLGILATKDSDWTTGSVLDLESLAAKYLGPVKVARGLARIACLTMPELGVSIIKPKLAQGTVQGRFANVSRFAMIEQRKAPPLQGLRDLTQQEQQYAALDAWVTLKCFQRFQEYEPSSLRCL
jgi:hypothetical protein